MVQKIDAGAPEAECTVRMKYQGVYYWFHVHLQNRLDNQGKPLKALGYAVLVDQLKAAEKMLTQERLKMQSWPVTFWPVPVSVSAVKIIIKASILMSI
jgi:uncharacterized membrane protein YwaF